MSRLAWLALVPLFAATGCSDFEPRPIPLVSGSPAVASKPMAAERQVSAAAPNEESARRSIQVGQRLILSNPEIGLRPGFVTPGVPYPEVFHKGGSQGGCLIVVSDGLVRACPSDAQLGAVIALELGKLVCERAALAGPPTRQTTDRLPPSESIGTDSRGTFGSSDGTRMMELAQIEARRKAEAAKPTTTDPATLAGSLTCAGYDPGALADVAPLLRQAEDRDRLDKQIYIAPPR